MTVRLTPRAIRVLALGYVVKTVLIGALWLAAPDAAGRAAAKVREAWARIASSAQPTP